MPTSKERVTEINTMPNDQIDTSDISELDDAFLRRHRWFWPPGQRRKQ